jgi:hypothetical protein
MTLHAQIKHFLKNVNSPDNLDSARDKLEKAILLLRDSQLELSGGTRPQSLP